MELEQITIATLFLNPELIDAIHINPKWLRGGYDKYFEWIESEYRKNPGATIRLSLCPYPPEVIDDVLGMADVHGLGDVVNKLRQIYLLKNFEIICSDSKKVVADDPDKWINKHNEKVSQLLQDSPDIEEPHVSAQIEYTLDTIIDRMERVRSGGGLVGIPTGHEKIDAVTGGWEKKENVIIAGRPGMGKTTCALDFAIAAARAGESVDIFSLEMDKHKLLIKMASQVSGIPLKDIYKGRITDQQYEEVVKACDVLRELPLYLHDSHFTLDSIVSTARRQNSMYDTGLMVIDYLQLIKTSGKGNREQQVSEVSRTIKTLGMELNCCTLTLSQLSRAVENRPDKTPRLSDLRESGSIEQDADMVIFPFREWYYYQMDDTYRTDQNMIPHEGTDYIFAKVRMGDPIVIKHEEDPMQPIDNPNHVTPRRSVQVDNFDW